MPSKTALVTQIFPYYNIVVSVRPYLDLEVLQMKSKSKSILLILLASILVLSFSLTACGSGEDEDINAKPGFEEETDPNEALSDSEKAALKEKAKVMNKDEKNFYGTWKGDEVAYDYYGDLTVTINEDGTVRIQASDEDLPGTWKKIDGGISYSTELIKGKIYYGDTCQMTIDSNDLDLEEEGIAITLTKQK